MSLLMISDITAAYGKAIVLQNLSLKVAEGEICALLGSNGSGKTTLIKTILGMVKATAGRIEFDGNPIQGMDTHRTSEMGLLATYSLLDGHRIAARNHLRARR